MKKQITLILSITILTILAAGCNNKNLVNDIPMEENKPSIEAEDGTDVVEPVEDETDTIPNEEDVSENSDKNSDTDTNNTKLLQGFEAWKDSEAIRALNQVLSMQETITEATSSDTTNSKLTNQEYYLNKLDTFLDYEFDTLLIPDQYSIVDLDQDGTPEVVVELSGGGDGWIKVLRFYEGIVYGYSFVYRGFETPKIDGTYMASSGAADNNIMRLSFDGINVNENCLGYSTSSNGGVMFYIGGEKVTEQEYSTFNQKYLDTQDVAWYQFQSDIRAGYVGQELLRVDFTARTHAQVKDMKEYYSSMEESGDFSHSMQIPQELCDLILDAMEHGTEKETFTTLMADSKISQEEFCSKTGFEPDTMTSVWPVRVDADNDGIEDLIGQCYWGGTGGFSSMELYQGSADDQYKLTNTFECFIQDYDFLQYQGKQYLLMKVYDYNTKYDSGYELYLYENGILADGKMFSFAIDDYDMDIAYEEVAFEEISTVKKTLCSKKLPEILNNGDGIIYGTAESISSETSDYQYSCDLDNDGKQENYNKNMWYPSNMGTVMQCWYNFEDSMILEDLCNRLSDEMGDGRLYTFWIDEVNGKNLLYLYFGNNLDYSMYAYMINGTIE